MVVVILQAGVGSEKDLASHISGSLSFSFVSPRKACFLGCLTLGPELDLEVGSDLLLKLR